jgi:negative regulator of flagellin synthesis FlgM
MRVPSGRPDVAPVASAAEISRIEPAAPVSTAAQSSGASAPNPLQSAVLAPAIRALGEMPEIDQGKVAMLRDALARGQLPFDASKLAALIERYHQAGRSGE